jgi:hypothetical protein
MKTALIASSFILTCLISQLLLATTYYVNGTTGSNAWDGLAPVWDGMHGPKATIQAGINASTDTDTVIVADGTYTGAGNKDLDFGGKAITLQSENGAATCIIDCEDSGRGFYFHSAETSACVVDGFTITNGRTADYGGGICCDFSSPTIINCTISGNTADMPGGGIRCTSSSPSITNCIIADNTVHWHGGGIFCHIYSNPLITNCTIIGNTADNYGGGINCYYHSNVAITNCILWGNAAASGH